MGGGEAALLVDVEAESAKILEGLERVRQALGAVRGDTVHIVEAIYLVYRGIAVALDKDGRELGFEELMCRYSKKDPYAWVIFEVYSDLKRRGKHPEPGPRPHTLLLRKRKHERRYTKYVLVLEENRPVSTSLLLSFVEESFRNSWEPLLAIVDRYGDITYYETLLFRPEERRRGK